MYIANHIGITNIKTMYNWELGYINNSGKYISSDYYDEKAILREEYNVEKS